MTNIASSQVTRYIVDGTDRRVVAWRITSVIGGSSFDASTSLTNVLAGYTINTEGAVIALTVSGSTVALNSTGTVWVLAQGVSA